MQFYKRKDIKLVGGPQDAEFLYSRYGVEAPCWNLMRRLSDGRQISISGYTLQTLWEIVDVRLIGDEPTTTGDSDTPATGHNPDVAKLEEQAQAWEAVYDICRSLGMNAGDQGTGLENVLTFIRRLHERCEYQNQTLDKAARQAQLKDQLRDRTAVDAYRVNCKLADLQRVVDDLCKNLKTMRHP